jgi:hypothetical protein
VPPPFFVDSSSISPNVRAALRIPQSGATRR